MDIESSTETSCLPPAWMSLSVRPSVGRISAVRPCTTWLRLSLVEICTVSAQLRSAASVTSVSGVADAKLPPMPMNTLARPSRIARIASTVSWPCLRGLVMPNRVSNAARNVSGIFSQMPIVRSPCTFECPRTGHTPAPGLPIMPRISSRLVASPMVATACRCWVSPIAQQNTVRSEAMSISATRSSCSRPMPVASTTVSSSTARVRRLVLVEARAVRCDEVAVEHGARREVLGFQQQPAEPREQRHVAAEPDLDELVGDRDAVADDAVHLLRILEPHQAGLGQRVDGDDLGAVGLCLLQDRQHAGMVGARVLTGDQDAVGVRDVVDGHRALADADGFGERGPRRFVAHVRAVGQVVGAEAAYQQLVEERGLVAGAARGVEHASSGLPRAVEVLGDQPVGVVPLDGPVVRVAGAPAPSAG